MYRECMSSKETQISERYRTTPIPSLAPYDKRNIGTSYATNKPAHDKANNRVGQPKAKPRPILIGDRFTVTLGTRLSIVAT